MDQHERSQQGPGSQRGPVGRLAARIRRVFVKAAVLVVGSLVVVAGIAMLVLPGPGLLAIAAGLALLSREFPWAARLLQRGRTTGSRWWRRGRAALAARGRRSR